MAKGNIQVAFADGRWLVPKRFNHGAFDAVQLTGVNGKLTARFVNVSRAARHDVKCMYIVDMLNALKNQWDLHQNTPFPVVGIEFVWIRPISQKGSDAIHANVIDASQLKQTTQTGGYNWDATTHDVFFKRTGTP